MFMERSLWGGRGDKYRKGWGYEKVGEVGV